MDLVAPRRSGHDPLAVGVDKKGSSTGAGTMMLPATVPGVPLYLSAHYWWAYIHPAAVKLFERQWLVNLILWGNYLRLREAVFAELDGSFAGRTLQVGCVYGDLTTRLNDFIAEKGGLLDVIDVLPIQLANLRAKLPKDGPARLLAMESANLQLPDAEYDQALVFFLLHEQPRRYREQTMRELCRVVRPGGKIIVVDYALPRWWQPLRYLWRPLLAALEPFALDLWCEEIVTCLPRSGAARVRKESFFGGLYQKVVITRRHAACSGDPASARARDFVIPDARI